MAHDESRARREKAMRRNTITGIKVWLVIGGVFASITGGLAAANYAVGGIDPFYRNVASEQWKADRDHGDVMVAQRDDFLPSTGTAPVAIPATSAMTPADTTYNDRDWAASDAAAQRDFERSMQLAQVSRPEATPISATPISARGSEPLPAASAAPAQLVVADAAPLQQGGAPVTPNHSLIY